MDQAIESWKETLAGFEEDLAASERRYTQALADVGNAWERLESDRATVAELRARVMNMDQVSA